MTAPSLDEPRPVPSAVLGVKIDNLASEVLELRRELHSVVRTDLYEEGRRSDHRRIEATEAAVRELIATLNARREAEERERAARRWQFAVAAFSAVVAVALAISDRF